MGVKKTPFCIVITMLERGSSLKVTRAYEKCGLHFHYRLTGEGTASSDLLNILGIGSSERDVLISPAPRAAAEQLVATVQQEGLSGVHVKGILCQIPLTGASTRLIGAMTDISTVSKEEGSTMENQSKQSMILIAVDQGFTDAVMDTARQAGARGGTVLRSHILKNEEMESFGGPTFAGERELIMIVASQGERNAIMEQVDRAHGGESPAHAILYSMPVEQTAHLS